MGNIACKLTACRKRDILAAIHTLIRGKGAVMLRVGAFLTAIVALAVLAGGYLMFGNEASAGADFTVTLQNDSADGVCDNDCSLREAIQNANTDPGPDVIAVPSGTYVLTIAGNDDVAAMGDLDITGDTTIQGQGLVVIDGNGIDRVLEVRAPATLVTITGVTVRNGEIDTVEGAGLMISTAASVQLQNCVFTDNVTTDRGGAIYNGFGGSLSVNNCTLDDNKAVGNGPQQGGNIYTTNASVTTLVNCTISNGEANFGAGLFIEPGGIVTATACTFIENNAFTHGGAVYNSGQLFWTNVTTNENHAGQLGGAVYTDGVSAATDINNSTLAFDTGNVTELYLAADGAVNVHSTILRKTTDPNCGGDPIASDGFNVDFDGTCNLSGPGDIVGDPQLLPLANNGGLTQTYLLGVGSLALNTGSPACPPPSSDQRGISRPQSVRCDIGAVEMTGAAPATTPPNVTNSPNVTNTPAPTNTPFGRDMLFGNNDCDFDIDTDDVLNLLLFLTDFEPDQNEPCPEIGDEVTVIE